MNKSRTSTSIESYKSIHRNAVGWGKSSEAMVNHILPYVMEVRPTTMLDYGCGKSRLIDLLNFDGGMQVFRYDPAIEEYSQAPPNRVDLLLNTDVLEHIPESELDDVLSHIRSLSDKCYFSISTRPAVTLLPNGDNAHCTVHKSDWWRRRLARHFPVVREVAAAMPRSCSFITWESCLPPATRISVWSPPAWMRGIRDFKTTLSVHLILTLKKLGIGNP